MNEAPKLKRAMPALRPVMIVDDDTNDAETFRAQLAAAGIVNPALLFKDYSESVAALTLAAIDGPRSPSLPCALFVNLKMGCYGGFDLLAWASEQDFLESVPRFILVPCLLPEDQALGIRFGAELVVKFPTNEQLAALLRPLLRERKN